MSKGRVVERILADTTGAVDFVLCIGDDRSDEEMFIALEHLVHSPHMPAETFACTVGQKPSKVRCGSKGARRDRRGLCSPRHRGSPGSQATYYLNDVADVLDTLNRLAAMSDPGRQPVVMTTSGSIVELQTQASAAQCRARRASRASQLTRVDLLPRRRPETRYSGARVVRSQVVPSSLPTRWQRGDPDLLCECRREPAGRDARAPCLNTEGRFSLSETHRSVGER